MRRPYLRKGDVLAWFSRYDPDEAVGIARDENVCPLACYLRDQRGYTAPRIYRGLWETGGLFSQILPLPEWAQSFVRRIDNLGHRGISAATAIEIMKETE